MFMLPAEDKGVSQGGHSPHSREGVGGALADPKFIFPKHSWGNRLYHGLPYETIRKARFTISCRQQRDSQAQRRFRQFKSP